MPDSLEESIILEKLAEVQNFNFNYLNIGELEKFVFEQAMDDLPDEIEGRLLENALSTLYEAKKFDLPKGYGRD